MSRKSQASRRPQGRSWKPAILAGSALALIGLVGGTGYWLVRAGHVERLAERTFDLSAAAGLAVAEITVEGRVMTDRAAVLHALGATRGTPLLAVSPTEAKARLEALPWVRTAAVARLLPDTLYVRLVERQPLALWQKSGKLRLIDRDGVAITGEHLERFPGLIVVVGEDAPKHAGALIDMLATEPALAGRVVAAVRVGERRWNLRFDNGIDVQLPEDGTQAAWTQLAEIERKNGLFARDVEAIDLRLPDRLVIRTVPEPPKEAPKKGRAAAKTMKNT